VELSRKYAFQIGSFRKSEMSFAERKLIDELPAVAVNDTIISKGQDLTIEDIRWMILRELSASEQWP
jgi:hypothetical protein